VLLVLLLASFLACTAPLLLLVLLVCAGSTSLYSTRLLHACLHSSKTEGLI
jgi:hypothetical protein